MSIFVVFAATIFEQFPNRANQHGMSNDHCYKLKKKNSDLTLPMEEQKII